MPTTNPLAQVLDLTAFIRANQFDSQLDVYKVPSGYHKIGPVISYYFGRHTDNDSYSYLDMLEDYKIAYKLSLDSHAFILENSSPKALSRNTFLSRSIVDMYEALGPMNSADPIVAFNAEILDQLRIISDNLEDKECRSAIPESEISSMKNAIDSLIGKVMKSSLDKFIKDRIFTTLSILRLSILRVNLIDTNTMVEQIESLMAQTMIVANLSEGEEEKKESKDIIQAMVKVAEGAKNIVESAQVVIPALMLAYVAVTKVFGQ
jgi:hypothetical protein